MTCVNLFSPLGALKMLKLPTTCPTSHHAMLMSYAMWLYQNQSFSTIHPLSKPIILCHTSIWKREKGKSMSGFAIKILHYFFCFFPSDLTLSTFILQLHNIAKFESCNRSNSPISDIQYGPPTTCRAIRILHPLPYRKF